MCRHQYIIMRPQKDTNRVKPANPKSFVWQHYEDVNYGKHVFCLLCAADTKQQMYQVTDNNTTSLSDHLQTKHIPEWRDLKAQVEILTQFGKNW